MIKFDPGENWEEAGGLPAVSSGNDVIAYRANGQWSYWKPKPDAVDWTVMRTAGEIDIAPSWAIKTPWGWLGLHVGDDSPGPDAYFCSTRLAAARVLYDYCFNTKGKGEVAMGDIGRIVREVELEPLEVPSTPITEPAPVVVPEPETEPVPA